MLNVGKMIRNIRTDKNMTLKDLAEKAEISVSYLSQIENDSVNMNLRVLEAIGNALNVPLYAFFIQERILSISAVKSEERDRVLRSDGVLLEYLTDPNLVNTNVHIMTVPAGYFPQEYSSHPGEEFLYLLKGDLEVDFNGLRRIKLNVLDSLAYPSLIPHKIISVHGCELIMNSTTNPGIYA